MSSKMLPKNLRGQSPCHVDQVEHVANFWLVGKVFSVRSCGNSACQLQQILLSLKIKTQMIASISVDTKTTAEGEQTV